MLSGMSPSYWSYTPLILLSGCFCSVVFSCLSTKLFPHASYNSVQTSELVANLFQECDPTKGDYHGLCKCVDGLYHEDFRVVTSCLLVQQRLSRTFFSSS